LSPRLTCTALNHMLAENGRSGSPFQGKIRPTDLAAMGHSTGGGAAIVLGQDPSLDVAVLGLVAPSANQSAIAGVGKPMLVLVGTFKRMSLLPQQIELSGIVQFPAALEAFAEAPRVDFVLLEPPLPPRFVGQAAKETLERTVAGRWLLG
jgi:acetyl esterase/lipase